MSDENVTYLKQIARGHVRNEPSETVDYCGNEDDAFEQGKERGRWEAWKDVLDELNGL